MRYLRVPARPVGLALLALEVAAAACTGAIDGDRAPGDDTSPSGTGGGAGAGAAGPGGPTGAGGSGAATGQPGAAGESPFACKAGTIDPGPAPLRRLTQEQYLNTVKDLFGDIPEVKTAFPAADAASAFGLVQADVSQVELENYQAAADVVAKSVATRPAVLDVVAPCAPDAADKRACARAFVQKFGARLYRAPVDARDIDRHLVLYDKGAVNGGYAHGIEVTLRGMLQATRFLYRVELGTDERVAPNAVKLSGWEVATRLSYSLWNTTPDTKLADAAGSGGLATKAGVTAQLQRMLQDPRGAKLLRGFLERWMGLPDLELTVKDGKLFPQWTRTVRTAMRTQAQLFFDHVLGSQQGRFAALLTSPTVFVPKDLAAWYGQSGAEPTAVIERTDGTASGLLTLPAILAMQSKPAESFPIYRGKFVREDLLCHPLPPPPDANIKPPEVKPGQPTRDRFTQHSSDPACRGCHMLIDPIGFAFETYDAIGRYRTDENGKKIDAAGEVFGTSDLDGRFVGVAELGKKMAMSTQTQACLTRQWFRYAIARFEQEADGCSMKALYDAFRGAGLSVAALPAATVQSDAFLYRRPLAPEVAP